MYFARFGVCESYTLLLRAGDLLMHSCLLERRIQRRRSTNFHITSSASIARTRVPRKLEPRKLILTTVSSISQKFPPTKITRYTVCIAFIFMYAMFNDVGQVVTTRYPACYSFNSKVVAWLLQPPFTTLLLGCHKVVTTRYPACYSFNSKVVSPRVQGCCMVGLGLGLDYPLRGLPRWWLTRAWRRQSL